MVTVSSLSAFDLIQRGEDAPLWVAEEIARAWALTDAAVRLIVLSENVTFRVDRRGVPCMVVRLSRPGYGDGLAHLQSELEWIDALTKDTRVPTPAPVPTADGSLIATLTAPSGEVWTSVAFEFVAGRVLEDEENLVPRFDEIGRLTALLHEHSTSWQKPAAFRRFRWDTADLVGDTARWGDWRAATLTTVERAALERAEAASLSVLDDSGVDTSPRHFGLIHGDLRPSNLMIPDDGAHPLVVIDFDDCGFGYHLYDFAAALTFYEHRPDAPAMAAHWLEGYRSLRALSTAELRAAVALSMLRRLTMLGWASTHRSDALPEALWNENRPGTVDVASRYLADPLWLLR